MALYSAYQKPSGLTSQKCAHRHQVRASPRVRGASIVVSVNSDRPGISEDVLERLKKAEEEASRLRKELAEAQGQPKVPDARPNPTRTRRVDGTESRETLSFKSPTEKAAWFSEADVDSEESEITADYDQTVQRRLLIGVAISAVFVGLSFVPTDKLRAHPEKPLYIYVIPLLRIKDLLVLCEELISEAKWDELRYALVRVKGSPNKAKENLDNCVAWEDDGKIAAAGAVKAGELIEYLDQMDYNKYFDSLSRKTPTGAQNAEFVDFSTRALKAAERTLADFLKLLPASAVATAQNEIDRQMS